MGSPIWSCVLLWICMLHACCGYIPCKFTVTNPPDRAPTYRLLAVRVPLSLSMSSALSLSPVVHETGIHPERQHVCVCISVCLSCSGNSLGICAMECLGRIPSFPQRSGPFTHTTICTQHEHVAQQSMETHVRLCGLNLIAQFMRSSLWAT